MAEDAHTIEEEVVQDSLAEQAEESINNPEAAEAEVAVEQQAEEVEQIEVETNAAATASDETEAAQAVGVDEAVTETVDLAEVAPTKAIPDFRAGDTLRLGVQIKEGDKVRVQYFEGIVLGRKGAGISQTFTIRKVGAGGVAVERIFPVYSPTLVSFEVRRRGAVRRAKIYFLRDIVGSTSNVIKERKVVREVEAAHQAHAQKRAAKAQAKAQKSGSKTTTKKSTGTTRSAHRSSKKSA